MDTKDILKLLLPLLAPTFVAAIAVYQYRRSIKLKKAEWIESLHTKFFESKSYKRIRRILDHDTCAEFSLLRSAITESSDATESTKLSEKFVDYLNFFEFIASLPKFVQLEDWEISVLFDYYLRLLKKHEFVTHFIRTEGFENLAALLERWPADGGNRDRK
jgi:hypothetical protein